MSFQDLAELLDPDLPLPISGKTYRIKSPDVKVGLRAQATVAIAAKVNAGAEIDADDVASLQLDDAEEMEFTKQMLGDQLAVMQADGVPWEFVRHATKTVFMWLVSDRETAEKVWANVGNPPRPVPQDRKAPARKTPSTKKTASSRSSSTRKTSPRTRASGGTTSSSSGT